MIRSMQATTRNPGSKALKRLYDQKNALQAAKEQYRLQKSAELRRQLEQMPNDMLRAVMTEYKIRREADLQMLADYENQVQEKTDRLTRLGQNDPAMEMLLGDIENLREVQKELSVRLQGMAVQKVAADRVRVIQNAVATPKINTIERFTIAGIGGLAAMLATCYAVALIEFRRRRLNGPRDIDEGLGVRVLGVLPATTARKSLAGGSLVSAQVAESIDNVRATLMHDSTSHRRQVVLVTSSATMEGSTTVSCNLAVSLARAGRRTLLIDGDVRAPALHKLFGLPLEDGLCEVLRSEIDLADVVQATNTEGLYLLTAGVCDKDAVHALATELPQPIFDKLRAEFDFVIIDGAPVLGLSDTVSLGQHVDGAILTLLRDHSEVRKIHQATELMKDLGIELIGAVVNGVPLKADRRIAQLHKSTAARAKQLPAAKKPDSPKAESPAPEPAKATEKKTAPTEEIVLDEDFDLGLDD
ncbi:MAG: polysaccharide biosynthesis tyrosine autokinase, partial [Planctomycetota bacterium]